jgi:hypothetical protein
VSKVVSQCVACECMEEETEACVCVGDGRRRGRAGKNQEGEEQSNFKASHRHLKVEEKHEPDS